MDRRAFFKASCGVAGLVMCPGKDMLLSLDNRPKVRFGMVTDLHYAKRESRGTRYFGQTKYKLNKAIKVFNEQKTDFVVELGDFKDQDVEPVRQRTLAFLDEIENEFRTFKGPVYHVLGNHDMDSISKADFLKHIKNKGIARDKTFYSFTQGGIKFIVLDANFNEDGSDYNCGNFDWTKAFIPDVQKTWLAQELNKSKCPVVIFIHQLLDSFSEVTKSVCVRNAADVVEILERNNNVLAVFQGHHHPGHYSFRKGIHYFTLKGMIEGDIPENNSFAVVEIDQSLNIILDGFYNCEDKYMSRTTELSYQII